MDSVSDENVEKLMNEYTRKQTELAEIKATPCQQMWLKELDALEQEYNAYRRERDIAINGLETEKKPKMIVKGTKKVVKSTKIQLDIV